MLFPIGDDNKKGTGPAFVTIGLLLINVAVFWLQLQDAELTYAYSVVPYEITQGEDLVNARPLDRMPQSPAEIPQRRGPSPIYLTLLTSMFMHGGWAHLLGNMLYLWIFGDNVEHRFGHGVFLSFYLVSGLAASAAQIALAPGSLVPALGASGAISGVLGAYLVLFPRNRVHAVFFFRVVSVPAFVAIGLWILFQFISGAGAIAATEETMGGVAYGAHIGGFFAGMLLAGVLRLTIRRERPSVLSRAMEADPASHRLW
jgi:membrane associated rhomboid family serine protease